jgi:hypothetical protein
MAGLDLTSYDYALEQGYPDGIESEVYESNPLFAMMPKDYTFGGKLANVEVKYADSAGRSSVLATAITNFAAHKGVQFQVTRKKDYAYSVVDRETLLASQTDPGAAADALEMEMESLINKARNAAGVAVWGSGSGSIGKVASFTSTAITLATVDDVSKFEVGDVLAASATDGGGTLRNSGATTTVTAIDRDTGVLTCDTTLIAALANSDFLFPAGDYDARFSGVQAWVPATAPSATTFYGVDRTKDKTRLGGIRYDGTSAPKNEALILGAARIRREGGQPTHGFMHPMDVADLVNILGSAVRYEMVQAVGATIGFQSIVIAIPGGSIRLFEDRNCPRSVAYLLDMSSWQFRSLGKPFQWVDEDGRKILRRATTDDYDMRVATYGNVICKRPGHNIRIALA